jgi:pimeloyl-ACP methyl ester carboxylesterase
MPTIALLLIHGVAVTAAVWDPLLPLLSDYELRVPERPRTGSLASEVAALTEAAEGAFIVGMSGGATLGLALASTVPIVGALLHEPAVGSLAPGLLAPLAAAYAHGGVAAFGTALYGPHWSPATAAGTEHTVSAELAMFSAFEPGEPIIDLSRITISVGAQSPAIRHESVDALATTFGYQRVTIGGASHFVTAQAPTEFVAVIKQLAG